MGGIVVLVITLTIFVLVIFVEWSTNAARRAEYKKLNDAGGLDGWGERVGLTRTTESGGSHVTAGGWVGTLRHGGASVVVSLDALRVEELHSTIDSPQAGMSIAVDLQARVPSHVHAERHAFTTNSNLASSERFSSHFRGFKVGGDHVEMSAFSSYPLLLRLHALFERHSLSIYLAGGVLMISTQDAVPFVMDQDAMVQVLDEISKAIDTLPDVFVEEVAQASLLRDSARVAKERWRAGRLLLTRHARAEAVAELATSLDELDELAHAACACWGRYPAFDLDPRRRHEMLVRVVDDELMGEDARDALATQVSWLALCDDRLDTDTRREAARRALRARGAPRDEGERDAALVALFTSESSTLGDRGAVLRALTRSGWDVTGEHAESLARSGPGEVRKQLLDHILQRTVRQEDARALAVLATERVPGAEDALIQLKSSAGAGRLSLSEDDASRGGLSRAGERGALTSPGLGEET